MPESLVRWLVAAPALQAAAQLVPRIECEGGWATLAGVALIFGLVNAILSPLLTA